MIADYCDLEAERRTNRDFVELELDGNVESFLSALAARDVDRVEPILNSDDEAQRKLADKLLDKLRGGQWDLRTDKLPREYATHLEDDRAEATFTVELSWKLAFGGRKREEVGFVAVFTRNGAQWRLAEVLLGPETKL